MADLKSDIETVREMVNKFGYGMGYPPLLALDRIASAVGETEARDAAVAREAKLQALCDMHATAMRLRKYGREPEWLGAAFTELRAKYEKEPNGE